MEVLGVLEKKIVNLLELVKTLREDKARLTAESAELKKQHDALIRKLESTENSMLKNTESIQVLNEEREVTRNAVDDLIKSIDALVAKEKQS